jgi:hypothetical protein
MTRRLLITLVLGVVATMMAACQQSSDKAKTEGIPQIPEGVQLRLAAKGLEVSWKPVPDASGYNVFWGKEAGVYDRLIESDSPSMVIPGLEKGALYSVAVTATNLSGESDYSEEVTLVYENDPRKSTDYLAKAKESMDRGRHSVALAYLATIVGLDPDNRDASSLRAALDRKLASGQPQENDRLITEKSRKQARISRGSGSSTIVGSATD